MPYRTFDDRIDGLVITFIDISDSKRSEEELNETLQGYRLFLNTSTDVIVKLSSDWKIQEFNLTAEKFFGKKRGDVVNQNYIELFIPEPMRKKTQKELAKLLELAKNDKINMQVISDNQNEKKSEWSVNVLFNNLQKPSGMILTRKI
jgi:two-component system CheB/CheR fusion protein